MAIKIDRHGVITGAISGYIKRAQMELFLNASKNYFSAAELPQPESSERTINLAGLEYVTVDGPPNTAIRFIYKEPRMNEMKKRVSDAIVAQGDPTCWTTLEEWKEAVTSAAITAMREPTEAMK